eukprot:UN23511
MTISRYILRSGRSARSNNTKRLFTSKSFKIHIDNIVNHEQIRILWGTNVEDAQKMVRTTEKSLRGYRESVRKKYYEVEQLEKSLHETQKEIERTQRGEDAYVALIQQENELYKEIKLSKSAYENSEKREREVFEDLLGNVREAHEEERIFKERWKVWGIVFACLGPLVGYFASVKLAKRRLEMFDEKIERIILHTTHLSN